MEPLAERSSAPDEARRGARLSAAEAIAQVVDPGTWREWGGAGHAADPWGDRESGGGSVWARLSDPQYRRDLEAARAATGQDEAVVVGEATVGGVRAALLVWEFGFLGGSIAVATAARLVGAIRRATSEGLPLVALPRSGGTRMQEGTPAFVQMTAITAALAEHRAAGLPYLVHLCHPTTGGVLATLGSAGDLTTAEPQAMIGFLGPRAVAAITGHELSPGVQVAENLVAHGIVDEVLSWPDLRARWAAALGLWGDRPRRGATGLGLTGGAQSLAVDSTSNAGRPRSHEPPVAAPVGVERSTGGVTSAAQLWADVAASRHPERPGGQTWIDTRLTDRIELTGTGAGEVGSGVRAGLARLAGAPLAFAATVDRETGTPLTTDGLRVLRRVVSLAGRWKLPLITVVDTLGAELSDAAEEQGVAGEISRTMLDLASCPTPTVALLIGPGTGGAALSLLAADRVVATSTSWVAPLPPEGAAAIRHHGSHDPARVAWEQQIGVRALHGIGFVDVVVEGALPDWSAHLARAAADALADVIAGADPDRRVARFAAWSGAAPR